MNKAKEEVERIIRWINRFKATKCAVFAAGDTLSDGLVFCGIIEEMFEIHIDGLIKRPKTFDQRISNCNKILETLFNLGETYSFSIPQSLTDANTAMNLAQVFINIYFY